MTVIQQSFDAFSRLEKPSFTLCNPDHVEIFSLNSAYNTEIKLRWNAQSEITFDFPQSIDGIDLDAYSYIEGKRIVLVSNLGYFIIDDVQETFDGSMPIKSVSCLSQESELVYKRVSLFSGTYSLSDLIGVVLEIAPNWTVESIDDSVASLYRTFDISDTNIYQLFTTEVSNSYNCIFIFDYFEKKFSIISADSAIVETDIFLSFDNLLKSTDYEEITTEITTCLYCYGGGNLTIRDVNPLGTNGIYNFTYYKTTAWMSQTLIDSITAWEIKVASYVDEYRDLLVERATNQDTLLVYQAELAELETQLAADEQVRDARIQQGLDTTDIDAQILIDIQLIDDKDAQIIAAQELIASNVSDLRGINLELSFDNTNNFTAEQLLELNNFIFENTYQNDSIIVTDSMSYSERQNQSQQLYDIASDVLDKASLPRYSITIDSVNFLSLQEFEPFINQLSLGNQITVDTGKGYFIDATLLGYDFSYDHPEDFNILLSNRKRLDDAHFVFTDFFGSNIKSSTNFNFNSANWNDWVNSKSDIVGNVAVPNGTIEYGILAENIKGTIDADSSLTITNSNVSGSSNFLLDQNGVVIRNAKIYSGSNLGLDGNLALAGGGAIFFGGGLFLGGAGLEPGSNVITMENLTSQVTTGGSYFTISGSFLANSLWISLNGVDQIRGYTYQENPNVTSFTMFDPLILGDILIARYINLS